MMNRNIVACFFFFFSIPLIAETWTFSAINVTSVQRGDQSNTVLEGNVQVNSKDLEISADHIELSGPDYDILTGKGNILLKELDKELTIEANSMDYDKNKKLIRLRGFVTLVDEKDDIVIRCESLEFYQEKELVILQAAVRLVNDKTIGRGEFATYRREDKILELSGRPVVWQDDDRYQADRITVNLDTDEISMEGTVQGLLTIKGDEEDEPEEIPDEDPIKGVDEETTIDETEPAEDKSLWK